MQTVDISSNGVITTDLHIAEMLLLQVHKQMPQVIDLEIIIIQVRSSQELQAHGVGVALEMTTFGDE